MNFRFPVFLLFFLLTAFNLLNAQNLNIEDLKLQFPEEEVVFVKTTEVLSIAYDEVDWNISRVIDEEMLYLENAGQIYAQKTIPYSGFDEISELNAHTLLPKLKGKKTVYDKIEVLESQIEDKDVLSGSIFYSDHKEKKFVFPSTQKGARTQLNYTQISKEPHLLGSFYFQSYAPVLESTFSVRFPKNVKITYKLLGTNTESVSFKESTEKSTTGEDIVYTWTAENLDAYKGESNAPSATYSIPHIAIYIHSVTKNDGSVEEYLTDVGGLYKWYSNLVKDVNLKKDPQLEKLVAELTNGLQTDKEKVKAIYQWVQKNIKYVAFEDGLGGFVPREAADVCTKKYGDCKDMSSILVEMLKLAELPAFLTWIGTRDRPYSYYDVPSPIVDNHMIAATKLDGKIMFLDGTGEYIPFGLPTSMIQGKEALVGLSSTEYKIEIVPVVPKEKNRTIEKISLSIEDRNLLGTSELDLTGYKKVFSEYARLRVEDDDPNVFFDAYLQKGSNKFNIDRIEESGFYNQDEDIKVNYDFVIQDYIKKAGDKLYVNLNLNKKFKNRDIDIEKRKLQIENEYLYLENFSLNLSVPEGYTVDYLPEMSSYADESKDFGFSTKYTYNSSLNQIEVSQEIYLNFLLLESESFEKWNAFVEAIEDSYNEVIVLKEVSN